MHAPDGFLTAGAAITTGAISAGSIGVALRSSRDRLADAQVPLAGVAAAFIFAAQMFTFPVAGGTSGHLLGGALAAILLGPSLGLVVVSVVVVVQALVFADGGLTAIGYNVLNMAVVTALGGWAVFRLTRRLVPATPGGVTVASLVAGLASVVLSSMAFSIEWLFGASIPIAFDTVFTAMVGVHTLIGIGEGVITAMVVRSVLASRPDLVRGASDVVGAGRPRTGSRRFVLAALGLSLLVAAGLSQFASADPDGLQRVAETTGIDSSATDHPLRSALFADYATDGVRNEGLSLAVAGVAGTVLTLAVGSGLLLAVREGGRRRGGGRPTGGPTRPVRADT